MPKLNRRQAIRVLGTAGGLAMVGTSSISKFAIAKGRANVVIIGGGAGGATAAHKIKAAAPNLDVTLIEPKTIYTSCFYSNLYIGGFRTLESLQHNYEGLTNLGINVIHDLAKDVNSTAKTVTLDGGKTLPYDKLVVSPGIALKYDAIEGYSPQVAQIMPHAWNGGSQTQILRQMLEAMDDGGTVVMAAPPNPYRCPPGPYERLCMIAHYLKTHKPKSKLILLDPKTKFSKQPAFTAAFNDYYKDIIDVNLTDELSNNAVVRVDPKSGTVQTADGRTEHADVANIIPPQRAGDIAHKAGLAKGDWCPVKPENMASQIVPDTYVLGDASVATQMPKSAFSANSQAKNAAADIVATLNGKPAFPPRYRNTCWSALAPDDSIKIGANYTPGELKGAPALVAKDSFVSKPGEPAQVRKQAFDESSAWYDSITTDIFAKSR